MGVLILFCNSINVPVYYFFIASDFLCIHYLILPET